MLQNNIKKKGCKEKYHINKMQKKNSTKLRYKKIVENTWNAKKDYK